jgi:hypothetical protein
LISLVAVLRKGVQQRAVMNNNNNNNNNKQQQVVSQCEGVRGISCLLEFKGVFAHPKIATAEPIAPRLDNGFLNTKTEAMIMATRLMVLPTA